ncbi:relaxase/mobilization nuclease domain-containing protein [Escherichia coli]
MITRDISWRKHRSCEKHGLFTTTRSWSKQEDALKATVEFLKETYPNHAFVAVYHDDKEDHPHVHVNIKLRDEETGRRLRLTKSETGKFRNGFHRKLKGMGYDVTATRKKIPNVNGRLSDYRLKIRKDSGMFTRWWILGRHHIRIRQGKTNTFPHL